MHDRDSLISRDAKRRMGLFRRLMLALEKQPLPAPSRPKFLRFLREASYPLSPLTRQFRRKPNITRAGNPQVVLVLPGFLAHPVTMRYLASQIERAGHIAHHWDLGINLGPTEARLQLLDAQIARMYERHNQPIVLLGWSLGGLFARELAKRQPELVAKVITLGSPFSGDPRANNAWRLYQFVSGHEVDDPPVDLDLSVKPPVETVAMWSPRDGVIAPRSACGWPGERNRAVALRCTHMGFSYSPDAVESIVNEVSSA